ncbi:histidine phosphatase family protein [Sphingobium amiense]|uniref:Histidine phosphatase family protein n=1 Tax=Sphingobium amiense TaxID=135719 RepID=A0A494W7P9_9SPHN|nr:histidine phosphatase family protein [Sphingobium amiense]BBD99168.1 histidine phosphatase family protein [Sphingobium amiense]
MSERLVHLVRHGPPLRPGLLHGHGDEPPADPAGGVTHAVPDSFAIMTVTCSDLLRARAGAETLARARGMTAKADRRWRELDFGGWDGADPDSVDAESLARFWNDPEAHPPPGGENWSAITSRVGAALADLPPDALVVTHAGAMRAAISVLTGLDFRQVWAVDLPYGALLSLRIWPGTPLSGQIVGLRASGAG